jgi:hypothetical protein
MRNKIRLPIVTSWMIALRLRHSLLNPYGQWRLDGAWLVHQLSGGGQVRLHGCLLIVAETQLKMSGLPGLILTRAYHRRLLDAVEQKVTF